MSETGAALFVMPHHDDEVFCAACISHAQRAKRQIRILWATAGGFAPPDRRRREGEAVARLLCLEPENHVSLGLPDQRALDHLDELADAVRALLPGVGDVYVPAYEGGHPDHDAVNLVGARVCAPVARVHEFAEYRRIGHRMIVKAPFPANPEPLRTGAPMSPIAREPMPLPAGIGAAESNRLPGSGAADPRAGSTPAVARATASSDPPVVLDGPALRLRRAMIGANASQWPELALFGGLALLSATWAREPVRRQPEHDYLSVPGGVTPLYHLYTKRRFPEFSAAADRWSPLHQ